VERIEFEYKSFLREQLVEPKTNMRRKTTAGWSPLCPQ